jgi:hypothetical protein
VQFSESTRQAQQQHKTFPQPTDAILYLLNRNHSDEVYEWESFKRNVQSVEKSLRHWITKTNIAVPNALKKQVRKDKDISRKIQPFCDGFLEGNYVIAYSIPIPCTSESFTFSEPKVIVTSGEKCSSMSNSGSIPLEKAVELCREHREKQKVRLFSQCWGCLRFSREEPGKMCFHNPPANRGCKFINALFDESKLT